MVSLAEFTLEAAHESMVRNQGFPVPPSQFVAAHQATEYENEYEYEAEYSVL